MLTQKLILSYFSRIVIQIIQMVAAIIVARVAGPSVIGTVAFGLSYVSMFLFLTDLGLPTAHIKLISEGKDEGNCITTFSYLKFGLIILFTFAVLGTFGVQKYILHKAFESRIHEIVIFLSLGSIVISEFFKIPSATFIAHVEQAKQDIPKIINNILFQILRLVVVLLGYKAIAIASSRVIATLLIAPLYYFLFKHYPRGKFDKQLAKQYLAISFPIIMVVFSQTIIYWSDRVMLQFFTNSVELGFYVAAFGFSNFVRLIQTSSGTIFFPTFSKHLADGDFNSVNTRIEKYERFIFIYVLPTIGVLAIFSDVVIKLTLGSQYLPTIPIFALVIIAVFIPVINLPYGNILLGSGLFKLSAIIWFATMLFFIISAYLFVNPSLVNLKGRGMALSLLLANLFLGVLYTVNVRKRVPEIKILKPALILILGIIYSLIYYSFVKYFIDTLSLKFILIFLYFFFYWMLLVLFKLANREDLKYIQEIFNIKRMKSYIRNEIKNKGKNENN